LALAALALVATQVEETLEGAVSPIPSLRRNG
jgi:hypothetical protein